MRSPSRSSPTGTVLGSLLVTMPPDSELVPDEEFVSDIAELAASAFASERRLALTHAEARRDALTGLANRRALDERLEAALREAAAVEQELTIVLFDLDDFKRFNDSGGHAAGDAVLAQVARAATRVLRVGEELFRVGGDEFAVVVDGGAEAGAQVADRIQGALQAQTRGGSLPTISAGVATYPHDATGGAALVAAADGALYASKRRGKSRVSSTRPRGGASAGERGSADPIPPGRPPRPPRALRRRRPEPADAAADDVRTGRHRDRGRHDRGRCARRDRRPAARCRRARHRPAGHRRADAVPAPEGRPGHRLDRIVLLTGAEDVEASARRAGADALLRKPFSPLELLAAVERLAGGLSAGPFDGGRGVPSDEQLLLYAADLRRLLEIERGRQALLQRTYRQTVTALAGALESKDVTTATHSQRVQRYAVELAQAIEPNLLLDPSVEYGFLLHDVGKIGIPDRILQKPGPLDDSELRLMRTHTLLGEQLLRDVELLHGDGLKVVRGHHERWDGLGYPDGLAGKEIPLAARIFTVADVLDAITSDRPYRAARTWDDAAAEILAGRGRQFDPDVVDAFRERDPALRGIRRELAAA